MEEKQQKTARAVNENDWCGKLGPSSKMQGDGTPMMSPTNPREFVFNFSTFP
jgi:hypothetical protein